MPSPLAPLALPPIPHYWTVYGASDQRCAVLSATRSAWGTAEAIRAWCAQLTEANPGYAFAALPVSSGDPRLGDEDWLAEVAVLR